MPVANGSHYIVAIDLAPFVPAARSAEVIGAIVHPLTTAPVVLPHVITLSPLVVVDIRMRLVVIVTMVITAIVTMVLRVSCAG